MGICKPIYQLEDLEPHVKFYLSGDLWTYFNSVNFSLDFDLEQ